MNSKLGSILSCRWTSTCQNFVKRKKKVKKEVKLMCFLVSNLLKFQCTVVRILNNKITFLHIQSCSILLCCKQSRTSSSNKKVDGNDFEEWYLQSRILKEFGRCWGPWKILSILRNLWLYMFKKASGFQHDPFFSL